MWKSLEAEKNDVQPTPPVGWTVQFLPSGDTENPKAAIVMAIEGAGRLTLSVLQPDQFPQTRKGVHYIYHPLTKKGSPQTGRSGSWRYLPDTTVPKTHNKFHEAIIARKDEAIAKAEADKKRAAELADVEAKPKSKKELANA